MREVLATKNTKDTKKTWPMVRLGDVCRFSRGLTYSKSDEVQVSSNAVLRSNNVDLESGHLILDELKYIRDSIEIPTSKRVSKGSILMCTANGSKQHLGKVALIDGEYDYAFGGFMGLLTPNADIDSRYLYWQLMSFEFKRLVTSLTDGANINNLKFADISPFTFPLPPLSIQREIVARLERELAAVEKIKKDFEALAETAKADYVAECRVIFERIAQEHPKVSLDDACEFIKDGTHQTPTYTDDIYRGYKFLSSKDVVTGEINWSKIRYIPKSLHDELYLHVAPQRGDILLAKNGTTGIGALVETDEVFDIYVSLALLRFKAGNNPRYLWYAVNSPQAREQYNAGLRGSGVPNLHLTEIRKVHICLPSVQIQDKVVSELDAIKARAEKLEAKAREGVAVCETMRKAILKEAFAPCCAGEVA